MRRLAELIAVAMVAGSVFAHAGHVHNYLGTVKAIDAGHLKIRTAAPDSTEKEFILTGYTRYTRNGDPVSKGELKEGLRVSVYVGEDGKTVTRVLLPPKLK